MEKTTGSAIAMGGLHVARARLRKSAKVCLPAKLRVDQSPIDTLVRAAIEMIAERAAMHPAGQLSSPIPPSKAGIKARESRF